MAKRGRPKKEKLPAAAPAATASGAPAAYKPGAVIEYPAGSKPPTLPAGPTREERLTQLEASFAALKARYDANFGEE